MVSATPTTARTVYQVSELTEILRALVEDSLPRTWVQGEISNFSRPASGHWYFTLKDARSQVRCAMFKGANFHVRPQPRDGDQVLVRGQVSVYPARGELQLICEHLEPAGEGALLRAFEQLKARLAAEGLFDEKLKRPTPRVPRGVGVITSGTGAALQDILAALARRFPLAPVFLYPVPVQGAEAAPAIVRALAELPRRAPQADVILLARGGGSLEDLWAFNEETVARAIRACARPVVTGIGHEIDFTIADFAADLRAPTPTAAAELVSPDLRDWVRRLDDLDAGLVEAMREGLDARDLALRRFDERLALLHPGRRLQDAGSRLAALRERLIRVWRNDMVRAQTRRQHAQARLLAAQPTVTILRAQERVETQRARLLAALRLQLQERRAALTGAESLLRSLSPLAVLERGYAIARNADGVVVTDAAALRPGEALDLRLARGRVEAEVQRVHPDAPPS
ncbi:MAG: exodeoxyribonuclease VII large subunit [Nevskiaceae bacterium]|nr:MAG: exodeoxyribonuclease VII large subunit [Nevskiaceae bacterium]